MKINDLLNMTESIELKKYEIRFDGYVERTKKFATDEEAIAWFDKFVSKIDDEDANLGLLSLYDEDGEELKSKMFY